MTRRVLGLLGVVMLAAALGYVGVALWQQTAALRNTVVTKPKAKDTRGQSREFGGTAGASYPKEILDERWFLTDRGRSRLIIVGTVEEVLPERQSVPNDLVPDVSDMSVTYIDVRVRAEEVLRGKANPGDLIKVRTYKDPGYPSLTEGERVLLVLIKKKINWVTPGEDAPYEVSGGRYGKFVLTADGRALRDSSLFPRAVEKADLSLDYLRRVIRETAPK